VCSSDLVIAKWLVRPGDQVARDQPLAEIETDKANAELPSPVAGVVRKLLADEGARVGVGADLIVIESDGAQAAPSPSASASASAPPPTPAPPPAPAASAAPPPPPSPSVRRLARERGVELDDLAGTGEHGRVTREDVLRAARKDGAQAQASAPAAARAAVVTPAAQPPAPISPPPPSRVAASGSYRVPEVKPGPNDQVIPFDRRRRIIAEHMVYSKLTAPHVVTVAEVDLHKVTRERAALPKDERPSFTAYVALATVQALRAVPRMNAAVASTLDALIVRGDIHLGVAVDAEEGLVVPVIHHADRLSLRGIADAIRELAEKARKRALRPDDLAGATFTLSNPGPRGNLYGGAIINQPQVGILRMGEIEKRPTVITTPDGDDVIVIHPKMYLALSYDHRVIDGVLGNDFLRRVREMVEAGDLH